MEVECQAGSTLYRTNTFFIVKSFGILFCLFSSDDIGTVVFRKNCYVPGYAVLFIQPFCRGQFASVGESSLIAPIFVSSQHYNAVAMGKNVLDHLCKSIKKKEVLRDISYSFEEGKIYGLYGRNGSGKTMLLRAVCGLIFPTSGTVDIDGKRLHQEISVPPSVGVIIENTELLPQYDALTNLKILAKIKKIVSEEEIKETIRMVGLDPESRQKVKAYSLGMRQKLAIAQAIFEKPELLLLDEPTNALDENSVINIRELFLKLREKGTTIIIASHNKEDLSVLADETLYINQGKLEVKI